MSDPFAEVGRKGCHNFDCAFIPGFCKHCCYPDVKNFNSHSLKQVFTK